MFLQEQIKGIIIKGKGEAAAELSEASIVDGTNVNKYYFCQVLQKTGGRFATYQVQEKTRGSKDKSPAGEAWLAYRGGNFTTATTASFRPR